MGKGMKLSEELLEFVAKRPGARVRKIRSEASRRSFFRVSHEKKSVVAMVYPEPSRGDIKRFLAVRDVYRRHGLRVPRIHGVLGDQVVLQEDAGDLLLQQAWRERVCSERQRLVVACRDILFKLAAVPTALAGARLDRARQLWEMDFFLTHFFPHYPAGRCGEAELRARLTALVDAIEPECVFAHRDFHSRNLLVKGGAIVLVDFQDSLIAPRYYDLASLAFDSYMDLGRAREILLAGREWPTHELRQLRLTALQRNIKALGTFAFQIHENKHPAYARYIPRTVRHIRSHLQELADPGFEILSRYFTNFSS
jgi:N-acetylmuramate 1-kinase